MSTAKTPTQQRLGKICVELAAKQLDAYIATNTSDIRWATAFSAIFDNEPAHLAFIDVAKAEIELHTDSRYASAMRKLADGTNITVNDERIAHSVFAGNQLLALRSEAQISHQLRVGIESDLQLNRYRSLIKEFDAAGIDYELVELDGMIKNLRAIKDAAEIAVLKQAQAITDKAFEHMLEYLHPGFTELQVAAELEFTMRSLGAGQAAFPSIVASGSNSAVPHAVPGQRVLGKGDFVLMDFGACFDDYCSDMTRTVILGKATPRQKLVYEAVLAAQTAAKEQMRAGVDNAAIANTVDSILEHAGYGVLVHGLGHGVGIDIHEEPILSPRSKNSLVAGNVVTVEPGIYIEGFGGVRIEDYGVVTETGFDIFTQSTHELLEL